MTSFDGTVVSTVTDCVEKTKSTENIADHTLRAQSSTQSCLPVSTSPTGSQLRKLGPKDVLRQVLVKDIGWASQVGINLPYPFSKKPDLY